MRILISPLDWGLGHATRDIPLIRAFRSLGHEVVIAATGSGKILLQMEFPELRVEELDSFSFRYTRSRFWLPLRLLAQLPFFWMATQRDKARIEGLVQKHGIDLVVADGRYGLRSNKVPSIFITHQLSIFPPGPAWIKTLCFRPLQWLNRFALRKFTEIWVPDFPGQKNLSGKLGHPESNSMKGPKVRAIFPLCRFRPESLPWNQIPEWPKTHRPITVLAWASGPEPQRTLFEKALRKKMAGISGTRVLVRGLPQSLANPSLNQDSPEITLRENALNVFDHLPGDTMFKLLAAAETVVCRSGYTSVMELAGLGHKRVLLVPTPGQPEQEYLAGHLAAMGVAGWVTQESLESLEPLELLAAIPQGNGFTAFVSELNAKDGAFALTEFLRNHLLIQARGPGSVL